MDEMLQLKKKYCQTRKYVNYLNTAYKIGSLNLKHGKVENKI